MDEPTETDKTTIQAESYARVAKEEENKAIGRDKSKMKLDIRKFTMKAAGVHEDTNFRVERDESEEAKESF